MNRFKLTKERRNQIYKSALLFYLNDRNYYGLCNAIYKSKEYHDPDPYKYPSQYPEVFEFAPKFSERPEDNGGYWFNCFDKKVRISILEQAIKNSES